MTTLSTSINPVQAVISLRAYMGPNGPTQDAILNATTPDSFTALAPGSLTITVPPSTSNQAFALATLLAAYTAPVFVGVSEQTALGFKITTASNASGKMGVAPGFWWSYMADGATALPTIYIDNSSSTTTLVLNVGVMTS
jgi:hypothetical protein